MDKPVIGDITVVARTAWNGWGKFPIQPNDEVLLQRGGSSTAFKVYDELERDAKVSEDLQKRRLALLSREYTVTPASESRLDKKAADFVREQFNNVGYDRITSYFHDALMKGTSFVEPLWAVDGSYIELAGVNHCEPWMFRFDSEPEIDDMLVNGFGLRIIHPGNMTGEKIPHAKMAVHILNRRYSNPWGVGLGNKLFWPVYFKRQGIQFWLAFAERFGTPVPWGKYPNNATPDQKVTLREALRAFSQEGSLMTPVGMEIELLEAARSGIDTYDRLVSYMDGQISGIILGKAGGGEGKGSGGQLAASLNLENEVRQELIKGDADQLDHSINFQLVRWMVDFNFPGAGYPSVRRVIEDPVDTKAAAETLKILHDIGYQASDDEIATTFGEGYTRISPPNANKDPAFSTQDDDPVDQVLVDALVSAVGAENLQGQAEVVLKPVLAALKKGDGYATALEMLTNIAPDMPIEPLAEALSNIMFVCACLGRLSDPGK